MKSLIGSSWTRLAIVSLFSLASQCVSASALCAADHSAGWHEFRGDLHNGSAPTEHPPTSWGESKNVLWGVPIHDRGWSSPVIGEGEVWLTTASEDGKKMYVMCLDFATGKTKHDVLLFTNDTVQSDYHITNSYASPTPVLDKEHVFVHFGSYGTACLDRKSGKTIWQRRDLPCNHYRGPGSSPILYEDLVIFHMDGFDHQYVAALNRLTGATVWQKKRDVDYGTDNGDYYKAFSTPLVIRVDGADQLISTTSKAVLAYDPRTGDEIWRVRYSEFSATARPLFDGTTLYINTGFGKAAMMAVKPGGRGDLTDSNVLWTQKKTIGSKPSQVLVQGRLFNVSDDGVFTRLDTKTGEIAWQKRLGGNFSSSLIATDKHVFAFDHEGAGYCFTAEDEPKLVSENKLPDGCRASPAIVENSLIVRTVTHLYRFAEK